MKLSQLLLASVAVASIGVNAAKPAHHDAAEKTGEVGGAPMYPSQDIIENAVNSKIHTTLVAAVKAADLVATLKGPGPFTVFAPENAAFSKLPPGTVETLVKPENKDALTKILTYHVVPGKLDSKAIADLITKGHGVAKLKTVQGEEIEASMKGTKLELKSAKGDVAVVTTPNVYQSNGVIHSINTVLQPK